MLIFCVQGLVVATLLGTVSTSHAGKGLGARPGVAARVVSAQPWVRNGKGKVVKVGSKPKLLTDGAGRTLVPTTTNAPGFSQKLVPKVDVLRVKRVDGQEIAQVRDADNPKAPAVWTSVSNLQVFARDLFYDRQARGDLPVRPAHQVSNRTEMGKVYNQYGGLIDTAARELGVKPAALMAILMVESGGKVDQLVRRLELHHVRKHLGTRDKSWFNQRFAITGDRPWKGHKIKVSGDFRPGGDWRLDPNGVWKPLHGSKNGPSQQERETKAIAAVSERINREVASKSASHGGPQVMGSNAELLGWGTAVSVNDALNPEAVGKEHAVLFGMASVLDFVANANAAAIEAIKKPTQANFTTFARTYNGPGQASTYGKKLYAAYRQAEGVLKSVPSPTTPAPTTPAPTTPAPTTPARPPTGSGTPVAAARGKLAKQLLDRGDMIAPIQKELAACQADGTLQTAARFAVSENGVLDKATVGAMQARFGASPDGNWGRNTEKTLATAVQLALKSVGKYNDKIDGDFGRNSRKALEATDRRLLLTAIKRITSEMVRTKTLPPGSDDVAGSNAPSGDLGAAAAPAKGKLAKQLLKRGADVMIAIQKQLAARQADGSLKTKRFRVKETGVLDRATVEAMQERFGIKGDGVWGPNTEKTLAIATQLALQAEGKYASNIDGVFGVGSNRALEAIEHTALLEALAKITPKMVQFRALEPPKPGQQFFSVRHQTNSRLDDGHASVWL
jgi:hypothetical protein